jgi:hypothetical protein
MGPFGPTPMMSFEVHSSLYRTRGGLRDRAIIAMMVYSFARVTSLEVLEIATPECRAWT